MFPVCCGGSLSSVDLVTLGTGGYQYTDTDQDPHLSFTDGVNTLCVCIYFQDLYIMLTAYYPYVLGF